MTNHVNTIKQLTVFEPCRSLVSKAVNKALPLVLISPLLLSSELSFAAQLTPNPNEAGNTISIATTDVTNDVAFDNSGTIKVEATGLLTNNASLRNYVGGKLNLNGYANHVAGKHNAFTNVGTLENSGTINLSAYQNFLVNQGIINNEAGGLVNLYDSNAHYNNNLRLDNEAGGVLNNKAGATITLENNGANKYFINDGVVNNDGSISAGDFTHFYNSGQFYNNVGASLIVKQARGDNNVGVLTNAGDASLSKWRNSYRFAQTIQNSGTLTLEKLTLTRPLTNLSGGTLTTKGNGDASVTFADNSPNSGSLYNSGTWHHNSGQSLRNEALIQNNSDGTINLSGYLNNAATFTNAGTLTLNSGSDLYGAGTFDQTTGTTLLNSQLAADGGVKFTGGLLTGDGRIILAANTLQIEEQAEVNPGTGVGTLSVTGNVTFNGQLTIELDAKEQGSFDELAVTGDINFGVASDVVFDFNFAVTEEFTIDFATAGSISNLSNLNYTYIGLSSGYAVVVDESGSKLQLQVSIDTDGDKIADLVDEDDDNDGYTDIDEAANGTSLTDVNSFPNDNDGDFISDLTDTDDDNDGVLDDDDAFPFDASESKDTDGDGIGDNAEIDADDDGINNDVDVDDDNDNLIEIRTLAELDEIRNNLSGTRLFGSNLGCLSVCEGFELSNDIDFDTSGDGIVDENDDYWNSGLGWLPIGSADSAFTAIIDGNFNTISKLTINRTSQAKVGLFAFVDSNAQLKNLTLADVDIDGKENVGSLVGNIKQSLVENISASGSLSAGRTVAGIIGVSQQTQMSKVSFVGRVTAAANNAGGIVAISELSTIEQAFHIGPVTATAQAVGGITGSSSSNISDVFSAGVITGGQSVGGIVGHMGSANLDRSFSLSTVNADSNAGAIIGYGESSGFSSSYRSDAILLSSVGAGDITDTSTTLTTPEFTCPQSAADNTCDPILYGDWDDTTPIWNFGDTNDYPGLFINGMVYRIGDYDNDGSHDNVDLFPLDDTESTDFDNDGTGDNADLDDDNDGYSDIDEAANGTSTTDENDVPQDNDGDFISDLTDLDDDNDGYSDIDEVANGTSITDENDKPLADLDGDYISDLTDIDDDNDNLIEVSTLAELDEVRHNLTGTYLFGSNLGCLTTCEGFELSNDLDFDTNADGIVDVNDAYWNGGEGWQPIGNSSDVFKSNFNGNGFTIKHLTINRPSKTYQGLFGKISQIGAVLNNLILSDVRIVGSSATGGLAGSVNGLNINNITVTGHVKGVDYTGGIIGNSLNSDISLSAHIGNVTAQYKAGGIVGATSNSNISRVYHIGIVDGDESAGGLVGSSLGNISDSFSAGRVIGSGIVGGIVGQVYGSDNGDTFTRNYSVSDISSKTENNTRIGLLFGAIANESAVLTSNYFLQDDVYAGVGESVVVDTSIALTNEQFSCPQHSNDVSCSPLIFTDWDDGTPIWNFGHSLQYPALVINESSYFLADYDTDGVSDLYDLFPSIPLGALADNDGDGAPDTCDDICTAAGMKADADDDNDGVIDINDTFPLDADNDGINDDVDLDDDNDGYSDIDETANGTSTIDENDKPLADQDGDYVSDLTDIDDDNDNLIEISTLADLDEIRNNLSGTRLFDSNAGCLSACVGFELNNDLDFDTNDDGIVDEKDAYWNDGLGWLPIGIDYDNQFIAKFFGNSFVIKNLTINRPTQSSIGLFGYTSNSAEIKQIGLEKTSIVGKYYVGALSGYSTSSQYQHIYSTGYVEGMSSVGGLIGYSDSETISNAYHVGRVYAVEGEVGGLIGSAEGGYFTNFYNIGPVTGSGEVGGLFGIVQVTGDRVNDLTNGYSVGDITGNSNVGGIAGDFYIATLNNVYSIASVKGDSNVGAIAGQVSFESEVNNSYWLTDGAVAAFGSNEDEIADTTVSLSEAQFTCPQSSADETCSMDVYSNWDDTTPVWRFGSNNEYPALVMAGAIHPIGDFDNDGINDVDDYFPSISIADYPDVDRDGIPDTCNNACLASGLLPDNDADFDGISDDQDIDDDNDDLIEIRTLAELNDIRNNLDGQALLGKALGCYETCYGFELVNDLDFDTNGDGVVGANDDFWNDGLGWNPLGDTSGRGENYFMSVFEGRGYTIQNLTINRPEQNYIGLFGATAEGAEIYSLHLLKVNIIGGSETGGLVGDLDNTVVENVSVTGGVTGVDAVGGLVGYSEFSSIYQASFVGRVYGMGDEVAGIAGCSEYDSIDSVAHIGPVTGSSVVGGVIGCNYSTLRDVFSTGVITGNDQVGGIAAYQNDAIIKQSVSTSKIVANSHSGAVIGWANNTGHTLEANYYQNGTATKGIGESEISDTTIGLSITDLSCPQSPGDESCVTQVYNDFDRYRWDFGDSNQLPALSINDQWLRIEDYDQDGVSDFDDLFPSIAIGLLTDTDTDGAPDNCDLICLNNGLLADNDDDNDGVPDNNDIFPFDENEYIDSDFDGVGDNSDAFPLDSTESVDSDLDGVGDNADALPNNANESIDTDGDGIGNNADIDDDGDGVLDENDSNPLNAKLGGETSVFSDLATQAGLSISGNNTTDIKFSDVDGDNDLDIVAVNERDQLNKIFLNNGLGDFQYSGVVVDSNDELSEGVVLLDIDNDQDQDMIVITYGSTTKLYLNDGLGNFSQSAINIGDSENISFDLVLGDVDKDNDLDLIVANDFSANKLYLNNGDGSFASAVNIGSETGGTYGVVLGDVNGDLYPDLITGETDDQGAVNRLYLNDGYGGFSATGTAIGNETDYSGAVDLGDVDGDLDLDLIVANEGSTNKLYLNNGEGVFSQTGIDIGNETQITLDIKFIDIDDDDDLDIVTANNLTTNKYYLNDGSGNFSGKGINLGSEVKRTKALSIADVDFDGDLDIVFANNSASNSLYLNTTHDDLDTDGDGIADIIDTDDDNDGYSDLDEAANGVSFKDSENTPLDFDLDFISDLIDNDDDNDGVNDDLDPAPLDANVYDLTSPLLSIAESIIVAAVGANGTPATDNAISLFLSSANAIDELEGIVSVNHDAPEVFAVGLTTVNFSATDTSGNLTSKIATVTVSDQTIPVISLVGNTAITLSLYDTFIEPGYSAIDNVDGDLTGSVVVTGAVNTKSVAIYTLTYDVLDAVGNIATTQTRQVSVQDVSAPVVIPANNIVVAAFDAFGTSNKDSSISNFLNSANATDDVDGVIAVNHDAPDIFPLGITSVTFSATDSAGNIGSAQAMVTIADQTQPVINLIGNNSMTLSVNEQFEEPGFSALDNVDGNVTSNVVVVGAVETKVVGIYTLTYSVQDNAGNKSLIRNRQVTVQDAKSPIIDAPNNIEVAAIDAQGISINNQEIDAFLKAASATDDVDSELVITHNAPSVFALGTTVVVFTAKDSAGNVGSAQALVSIVDETSPVITLAGEVAQTIYLLEQYLELGFSALDNVDGDISQQVIVSGAVDNTKVGIYSIHYDVNDEADNAAETLSRQVIVQDPEVADSDNDGVVDTQDAFPSDNTEWLDTDNDGTGNNADLDDDNDNVDDTFDDFPLDTAESVDTDLDGIGNNTDTDDDNDGIADELDGAPLNAAIGDTQPPVFTFSDAIFVKAQGRLTDISAMIDVKALDAVDGEITAKIDGEILYVSGQHILEVSATDAAGNIAHYQVEVNIKPELNVMSNINVEAGASYALGVYLSGEAPHYPVEILYNTYLNGEVIDETWANIATGTQGEIIVAVPDGLAVSDNLSIGLEFVSSAYLGENTQAELRLVNTNIAPLMQTIVSQHGQPVSILESNNGIVTVQVNIEDTNSADQHDIQWLVQDNALVDVDNDGQEMTFEIDSAQLVQGSYVIDVTATENNTSDGFSVSQSIQLVVEKLAILSGDTDSDNDGINDNEEGYSDTDGDGIVDYLDDNSNPTELPSSDNIAPMQTAPGLTMALGAIVRASSGSATENASLTLEALAAAVGEDAAETQTPDFEAATPLYNFTIGGLSEQGDSVAVIIPLASDTSLPEGAVYRKYNTVDGWYTFVEDAKNSVSSAKTDINGNCPAANDDTYALGLKAGDNCIQLIIEDGGENDADFEINGSVEDPGAVMIASPTSETINTEPVVNIDSHQASFDEATQVTLVAQGSDAEGNALSYRWSQLSGSAVSFDDTTSAQVSFALPEVDNDETIELQVTVSDGDLSVVKTTTFSVINIVEVVETPEVIESVKESKSSGGSVNVYILLLLLIVGYQRRQFYN